MSACIKVFDRYIVGLGLCADKCNQLYMIMVSFAKVQNNM